MNKEKIIGVLRKEEALVEGRLVFTNIKRCGHVGRCAIGALLFHAGMTNRELNSFENDDLSIPSVWDEDLDSWGDELDASSVEFKAQALLKDIYGIEKHQIYTIISCNDGADSGDFADECKINEGPKWKQDRGRVCAVIKEIERM